MVSLHERMQGLALVAVSHLVHVGLPRHWFDERKEDTGVRFVPANTKIKL